MTGIHLTSGSNGNATPSHEAWVRRVACACFVAVGSVAALVLLSWIAGRGNASALEYGYVPVAPSTGALLLGLSAAALLRLRRPGSMTARWLAFGAGLGVLAANLLAWGKLVFGITLPAGQWLTGTMERVGQIPVGQMSPLTASVFVSAALALLLQLPPWSGRRWLRQAAAMLALVGVLLGLHVTMGYIVQAPVLYGGTSIPMAAVTAAAFFLLGLGLLLTAGTDVWPMGALFSTAREGPAARQQGMGLLALFLLLSAAVGITGYFYVRQERIRGHLLVQQSLATIADLKVHQVQHWRAERLAEAAIIFADPETSARARRFLAGDGAAAEAAGLRTWLSALRAVEAFRGTAILDREGRPVLWADEGEREIGEEARKVALLVQHTGEPAMTDLHRSSVASFSHLDLAVPVPKAKIEDRCDGAVLLRVDPQVYLYPMISAWSTLNPSGETLLVRREGGKVVYLNELRTKQGSEPDLRLPIDSPHLPEAMAARGESGVMEGRDYRGVRVLAAFRPVPGLPWGIVTKVDMTEVEKPMRRLAGTVASVVILFLVATGSIFAFLWKQQQAGALTRDLAAQAERQALENRFDYLAKHANDMILLADAEGRYVEVNDSALRGYGYTREEMLAMSLGDTRAPRARGDLPGILRRLEEAGEEGLRMETTQVRKDGTEFPVEISARFIDVDGRKCFQAVVRDITERQLAENALRASEVKYRRLFEAARDGILILDAETGAVVDVNPFLIEMLGFSREQLLGQKIWELGFFKDIAANKDNFDELQQNDYVRYEDRPLETAEGRRMQVEFVSNVYLVEGKKVIQCNIRDISERKRDEAQIRSLNADLEKRVLERTAELTAANGELESFAYSVSHDLRAPLRGIDGWSHALLEDYRDRLDETGKRYLETIRFEAQRMAELIDAMLQLAKVGRGEIKQVQVDLAGLARTTERHLREGDPGRSVEFVLAPDLGKVRGDPQLLGIVLQNLLGNAWKFTANRTQARIELGVERHDGRATYFVRDDGAGFDMAFAQKLFQPFQRLHHSSDFPGVGVGLATVQRILQRHGGAIWAEGEVGRGATFYFTFGTREDSGAPARTAERVAVASDVILASKAGPESDLGGRK